MLDSSKNFSLQVLSVLVKYSDEDAEKYIKIFTFLSKEEIDALVTEHKEAPHMRLLQKKLAEEITVFVHSKEEYENSVKASDIIW